MQAQDGYAVDWVGGSICVVILTHIPMSIYIDILLYALMILYINKFD